MPGSQGPAGHQGGAEAGAGIVQHRSEAADILIDAKTMLAALDKPGIALLDVRDVDEWIGESSSPMARTFVRARDGFRARSGWNGIG